MSPRDTELQEVIHSMRQLMSQTQQLLLQYAAKDARADVLERGHDSISFQDNCEK